MKTEIKNSFSFIKNRKIFYIITVSFILIGLIAGGVRGFNYGIDFTGGTLLQINMHKHVDEKDLRESLKKEGRSETALRQPSGGPCPSETRREKSWIVSLLISSIQDKTYLFFVVANPA